MITPDSEPDSGTGGDDAIFEYIEGPTEAETALVTVERPGAICESVRIEPGILFSGNVALVLDAGGILGLVFALRTISELLLNEIWDEVTGTLSVLILASISELLGFGAGELSVPGSDVLVVNTETLLEVYVDSLD